MTLWVLSWLALAQFADAKDFPKELQQRAVAASVRVVNRAERTEGSGVIIGRERGAIYVLTAAHLVNRPGRLAVSTFTAGSYPEAAKVYERSEVVAQTRDVRDLALVRVAADDPAPGALPVCPERLLPSGGEFEALSVGCGAGGPPLCLVEKVQGAKSVRRPQGPGTARFWEVAREQSPGRSGGALLDQKGRVIGLASGTNKGKGYYCHATEIRRWLQGTRFRFLLEGEETGQGK